MNTNVLPSQVKKLLNQPRQLAYLLGLGLVVLLGAVLILTVLRVQNQQSTIGRPQAAEPAECTAIPGCCGGMASAGYDGCGWTDRGWCTQQQCDAAEGKGSNSCAGNGYRCNGQCPGGTSLVGGTAQCDGPGACEVQCRNNETGQTSWHGGSCIENNTPKCRCGSLRAAYCGGGGGGGENKCGAPDKDIACANNCVDNIRPGNCSYCKACCAAGNCSKTTGGGGAVTVFVKTGSGANYGQSGTVRMTSTSACSACNSGCGDPVCSPNREKTYNGGSGSVSWADSSKGATYVFTFTGGGSGSCTASAGGNCTITVGGGGGGCEDDSGCTGNQVCVDGSCKKKNQTHLECVDSACKRVSGSGSDQGGCTAVGAACGGGGGNGVDLQMVSITVEAGAPANGIAKVHATIKNIGTVAAGSFKVAADKKNGSGLMDCSGNGDRSVEVTVSGLAAGETKVVDLNMPTPVGAGSFNAAAMADSGCQITETSEANNTKVTPYTTTTTTPTCVDSQCPSGQACFSGSCKAYHLGCTSSNVCSRIEGAGSNTQGCIAAGQVCGGELGSCWGNEGTNGRCIDCNGDGTINILDFSCLACNWSEKFTPDQNPSCRTNSSD